MPSARVATTLPCRKVLAAHVTTPRCARSATPSVSTSAYGAAGGGTGAGCVWLQPGHSCWQPRHHHSMCQLHARSPALPPCCAGTHLCARPGLRAPAARRTQHPGFCRCPAACGQDVRLYACGLLHLQASSSGARSNRGPRRRHAGAARQQRQQAHLQAGAIWDECCHIAANRR